MMSHFGASHNATPSGFNLVVGRVYYNNTNPTGLNANGKKNLGKA